MLLNSKYRGLLRLTVNEAGASNLVWMAMNKRPQQEQSGSHKGVDALDVMLQDLQDEERTKWIHAVSVIVMIDTENARWQSDTTRSKTVLHN